MRRARELSLPALLALVLALLGASQLDRYGVTWDEALGDFFWGQRYLSFFASFDSVYLQPEVDPYPEEHRPDLRTSPFRDRPWEYYPFANVLAAATSRVLANGLGWLDPFDGFHAVNLWLGAILLVALWRFVVRHFGMLAATLCCLLLFLSPRLVVHALANVKDFPQMVLFALTLLAFHAAWRSGSAAGVVASGVLWGCALATKANALFLPAVVLAVVAIARVPERWSPARVRWLSLAGAAVAGPLTMVALWPWLWPDPISRYWRHLEYVSGQVFQVRAESLLSPTTALLGTTPPAFLLLAALGLVPLIAGARERRVEALLVLAWITVVLGRLHLPGAVNFDGVRHFLELFPALAISAGLGGAWLVERGVAKWSDRGRPHHSWLRPAVAAALTVVSVGSVLWSTVRTHPHQLAYWNQLVGGTRGAWDDRIPQAGDYWATSYREGLGWLGEHGEPGAVVTVPIAQHTVDLVARERLRADLGLAAVTVPNFPDLRPGAMEWLSALSAQRPVYVMFVLRRDWMNELTRDCLDRLEPEAEWSLDGVPLMRIYRFRPAPDRE